MGIGTNLILIAVGAILDFGIDVQTQGFDLHTIGVILIVVGAIGALLSVIFWNSWGGFRRTAMYDDAAAVVPHRRRVVHDEELV